MENDLIEINKIMEYLETAVQNTNSEVKIEAKHKLDELRLKAEQLIIRIDKIKSVTESEWDKTMAEIKNLSNEFSEIGSKARVWLSQKIDFGGIKCNQLKKN